MIRNIGIIISYQYWRLQTKNCHDSRYRYDYIISIWETANKNYHDWRYRYNYIISILENDNGAGITFMVITVNVDIFACGNFRESGIVLCFFQFAFPGSLGSMNHDQSYFRHEYIFVDTHVSGKRELRKNIYSAKMSIFTAFHIHIFMFEWIGSANILQAVLYQPEFN